VSKTALTTCAAAPKPARMKMTVAGEADAPLSSHRLRLMHLIDWKKKKVIDTYY
jgi:hypothetical protein